MLFLFNCYKPSWTIKNIWKIPLLISNKTLIIKDYYIDILICKIDEMNSSTFDFQPLIKGHAALKFGRSGMAREKVFYLSGKLFI